jgi:subtilase family serine protease
MTSLTALRRSTSRYRRAALVGIGAVTLGASALAGAGSAAARPQAAPHSGVGATRYVTATHLCKAPQPGEWSCFAMALKTVSRTTPGARPMNTSTTHASSGPAGGFSPADLAKIYGYTASGATGQTVAIVDAYRNPHALGDLNTFDAAYHLPRETATSFREVNQNGATSPLPALNENWAGEIDLDVQAVRGVCNKCRIILIDANSQANSDLAAAVNTAVRLRANEVSNSYGGPEIAGHPLPSSVTAAYNHPGVLITASTGDNGWYDWNFVNLSGTSDNRDAWSDNAPNTPSSLPSVLAVGGTTVTTNLDGSRHAETVWNSNGDEDTNGYDGANWTGPQGASGGGCSTTYNAPSFQSQATGFSDTGCGTRRMTGDVSADADPGTGYDVYDTYMGGWTTFGGTSLSSPLIAGMWALAGGAGGAYYPPGTVYDHLVVPSSAQPFDVTAGGNALCGGTSPSQCLTDLRGLLPTPITNPNHIHNGNTGGPYGGYAGLVECGISNATSNETAAATQFNECHAAEGYDGPSGVGTPAGLGVFSSLLPRASVGLPATRVGAARTYSAINYHNGIAGYNAKQFTFEFGDGTAAQKAIAPATTVSHTYTKAGTYLLTLVVIDDHGRAWFQSIYVKLGYPLTAKITGPASAHRNVAVSYSAAGSSDPNSGDTITRYIWTVGSTVVSQSQSFTYHWPSTGNQTLSLQVVDNAGQAAKSSLAVSVVP